MVPEDLSGQTDEQLTELGLQIRERVEGLADEARTSDDTLAEVEGLISSFDRINDELTNRETASAERSARLDAAMSRFAPEAEAETAEAEDPEVAADEEEEEAPEVAAAAVEETMEAATEEVVETAAEEVVEAAIAEEVAEEAATEDAVEATIEDASTAEFAADADPIIELATEDAVEASSTNSNEPEEGTKVEPTNRPTVAGLRDRRPEAVAPRPVAPAGASFTARGIGGAVNEGQNIDIATLAKAIVDKQQTYKAFPPGPAEYVTVATAIAEFGEDSAVTGSLEDNFKVLRSLSEQHAAARTEDTALVASGGVCAPLEQNYDFFRLAEEMNPVERCLPVASAPRGGIRYIQPPDFRDAAPGVRVTTEAEDAAGYVSQGGPTADKPCVAVECPPIQECRVDAVSKCVTFGNLNYRVFPEQVAAFLADLAVIFTETKEIFYLDAIDAASTAVTSIQSYSAVRTLVYDLLAAAANYRRRHHMRPDATLDVLLPSWLPELLKVDMVNDHALGMTFIDGDGGEIDRFFAQANLSVCWYYDSATGAGQAFNTAQGVGDLNSFPSTTVSYLFAPGTFVRLDAGTLDVGLVRDSILNGTNDLQLFAEQWIQVCMVGLESLRIEHTLCPDGTGPEPVTPLLCPTGSS